MLAQLCDFDTVYFNSFLPRVFQNGWDHGKNSEECNLCHKLWLSNSYIFAIQCRRPCIFQTMISVGSNNLSLKYKKFTWFDIKDIGIRKLEFVAMTQFLCSKTLKAGCLKKI